MSDHQKILDHVDANIKASTKRLFDLLKIRSISTDPAFKEDCNSAANWLENELQDIGFDSSVRTTPGHPMVVAHDKDIDKVQGLHVLFYGHYDVQPVDPIDLWDSDPFEPQIKSGPNGQQIIVGRGTSDDKGQLMTFVEACRAFREVTGDLPIKVSMLFEGEEESGSPSMQPFLQSNKNELGADLALVCDTGMWDSKTPALTTMLRGLLGEEIVIIGPDRDLHSGMFGGAAQNPIHILTRALSDLHGASGKIMLPDFYEGVFDLPEEITGEWQDLGATDENFLGDVGLKTAAGESGYSALEQIWTRPTCEINGIWGGYTGEGFKTVLPSIASAKVSFRLVGHQDPLKIRKTFREFVRQRLPQDCSVKFFEHGASPAVFLSLDSEPLKKTRAALAQEWGKQAALVGCGGSIPIVGEFKSILGMDSLLTGFALDDDNIHSPNEKYDLASFHKGIRSWVRILAALAQD